MNPSKRAFLRKGAAVAVALSLSPLGALAAADGSVTLQLEGSDGSNKAEDLLTLNKEQMARLQDLQGEKRAGFLAELILRWLKKRFPDLPWPKMGNDFGQDLTKRLAAQMDGNGILDGEKPLPKIKIKVKVKFKPPSDWEISIEINF